MKLHFISPTVTIVCFFLYKYKSLALLSNDECIPTPQPWDAEQLVATIQKDQVRMFSLPSKHGENGAFSCFMLHDLVELLFHCHDCNLPSIIKFRQGEDDLESLKLANRLRSSDEVIAWLSTPDLPRSIVIFIENVLSPPPDIFSEILPSPIREKMGKGFVTVHLSVSSPGSAAFLKNPDPCPVLVQQLLGETEWKYCHPPDNNNDNVTMEYLTSRIYHDKTSKHLHQTSKNPKLILLQDEFLYLPSGVIYSARNTRASHFSVYITYGNISLTHETPNTVLLHNQSNRKENERRLECDCPEGYYEGDWNCYKFANCGPYGAQCTDTQTRCYCEDCIARHCILIDYQNSVSCPSGLAEPCVFAMAALYSETTKYSYTTYTKVTAGYDKDLAFMALEKTVDTVTEEEILVAGNFSYNGTNYFVLKPGGISCIFTINSEGHCGTELTYINETENIGSCGEIQLYYASNSISQCTDGHSLDYQSDCIEGVDDDDEISTSQKSFLSSAVCLLSIIWAVLVI